MSNFIMWESLSAGAGQQGMQFDGAGLNLAGSSDTTITIGSSDILTMLQAALDSAVLNEDRQPEGDKFKKARDALGGAAGVTHSGHTYATAAGIGTQMTRTSGSITFDIGNVHAWAVAIASLCQSVIPDAAGQLQRS